MVVRIWVQQRELLVIANFKRGRRKPSKMGEAMGQSQEGSGGFVRHAPRLDLRLRTDVILECLVKKSTPEAF